MAEGISRLIQYGYQGPPGPPGPGFSFTGTGIPKFVSGVPNAAASPIINADIDPAAAIAVTKLAAGTNTYVLTTTAGVVGWAAPSGGGGSTPTGTGLPKIVGGVQQAAAALLVNADVSASADIDYSKLNVPSAAIALAKLVQPTGTGVVKAVSSVIQSAASTIVDADVDAAAAIAGTKVAPNFGSQNIQTTGNLFLNGGYLYSSAATGLPTTGIIRLHLGGGGIVSRNTANTQDIAMMAVGSGDTLYIGISTAFGAQTYNLIQGASQAQYFAIASQYKLVLDANGVQHGAPCIGYATPYSVDGQITSAHTDANYTVPAGEYIYQTVKFGSLLTAGRTITFPAPASDAAGYVKDIINLTTQTLTITTGAGATKTIAAGLGQRIRFTSSEGCKYASGTYTP